MNQSYYFGKQGRMVLKAAIALVVLMHVSGFAQWTHSGTLTYLANTGDLVGIGFTTPTAAAKVDINPTVTATTDFKGLRTGLVYNGTTAMANWLGVYIPAPSGTGTITNKYALVTESGAGNIGFGTTTPTARLEINPTITATADFKGFKNGIVYNGATAMANWFGGYIAAPTGTGTITNKYALVTEANAGKVGIGTTAPARKFTVFGGITADSLTVNTIPALATSATVFLTSNAGAISSRTAAQTLTDIGIGTWVGSTSITTLGTIATGSIPWARITTTPTTLSGYGITNAEPAIAAGTTAQYWRGDKTWQTLNAATIGLGNVENTALSTWTGSDKITALGTIASGSIPWARITTTPTTLSGYGITNAEPAITAGATTQYWRGDKTWQTLNAASVGLGNVQNININSWGGSGSITTVGAIVSGSIPWGLVSGKPPITTDGTNIGIGSPATIDQRLVVNGGDARVSGASWTTGSSASVYLGGDQNNYIRATNGSGMRIGTTGAADAMTLAENTGDVTITRGNLVVTNGKIKIKSWSIQEPDYVFEKGYNLPKLKEVEKYVADNKHLPEVPGAAEMKKNGVDVMEMNFKLLKKVEELTMYSIEQNKRIEALERKIQEGTK